MESNRLISCKACDEVFLDLDQVIFVDNSYYHKDCVELYPTSFVAFYDHECLGQTENEDGTTAWDILDEGEYISESGL